MFKKVEFERSVFKISDIPAKDVPGVVLCGRSNVGKSTFLNSLFNRKNLARVSSSPGKTRSINYYNVDDTFHMIDLPGYGYAKVSKKEREFWGKLVSEFILNTEDIQLALHLIDSRHKATELDIKLNEMLTITDIPYIILLNKADKLKQSEFTAASKNIISQFPDLIINDNLFFYSSTKGRGKKEIVKRLYKLFYLK
jgi:GTP-binding protein